MTTRNKGRGHDYRTGAVRNTQTRSPTAKVPEAKRTSERVTSKMPTVPDGPEDLKSILPIGAITGLEIIDEPVLRPSRFDRILAVPCQK